MHTASLFPSRNAKTLFGHVQRPQLIIQPHRQRLSMPPCCDNASRRTARERARRRRGAHRRYARRHAEHALNLRGGRRPDRRAARRMRRREMLLMVVVRMPVALVRVRRERRLWLGSVLEICRLRWPYAHEEHAAPQSPYDNDVAPVQLQRHGAGLPVVCPSTGGRLRLSQRGGYALPVRAVAVDRP